MALDKLVDSTQLDADLTTVANAIRSKGGTSAELSFPSGMAAAIGAIQTGAKEPLDEGVNFIDYDGTVVETWEPSEVAGKTALPNNPTHEGLTAQGWNWTLSEIQAYAAKYYKSCIVVGQLYETVSGLSEFDITVTKASGKSVSFSISGTKDWGDGTSSTSNSHTYADYGNYTVKINTTVIGNQVLPKALLNAVRLGGNVELLQRRCFYECRTLKYITMPNGVTSQGGENFYRASSLTAVIFPRGFDLENGQWYQMQDLKYVSFPATPVHLQAGLFQNAARLRYITIPDNTITTADNVMFSGADLRTVVVPTSNGSCYPNFSACNMLKRVIFPPNITIIPGGSFSGCNTVDVFDFSLANTVPTLENTDAFLVNYTRLMRIEVPASLYDNWITATNWSTYADYIYPV